MTREELKELGVPEDLIGKIMDINGTDINKAKVKADDYKKDLDAANMKISNYENEIGELKKVDAAGLQKKIDELQQTIDDRKAADDEAIRNRNLAERFEKATGEKKYLNDFTKNGVFDEFKKAVENKENSGKSDTEIYEALVKDRAGIFESEHPGVDVPGINPDTGNISDENKVRAVMGLPPIKP